MHGVERRPHVPRAVELLGERVERDIAPAVLAQGERAPLAVSVHEVPRIGAGIAQGHAARPAAGEHGVVNAPALPVSLKEVERLADALGGAGHAMSLRRGADAQSVPFPHARDQRLDGHVEGEIVRSKERCVGTVNADRPRILARIDTHFACDVEKVSVSDKIKRLGIGRRVALVPRNGQLGHAGNGHVRSSLPTG